MVKKIFRFINIFIWIIIFIAIIQYIAEDWQLMKENSPLFVIRNLDFNYDSKMEKRVGKVFYDYVMFVKKNTPEDATILIPPQAYPWGQTGNIGYVRYFLYPRNLVNGNEKDLKVDPKSTDYVLIDYGETDIPGYIHSWPKFDVNAEYVIFWNPSDGITRRVDSTKYLYNPNNATEQWGLIKVKR